MLYVFPDYYKDFQCIADRCRHNCCIGWEIDVDEDTKEYYDHVPGDFGLRLRDSISVDDQPHFILSSNERCPFLNDRNLCDIITTLGQEHLCEICAEHPRFHNQLPGRTESGLGLCCEEAARLIITRQQPVKLEITGLPDDTADHPVILLRDKLIGILQDRSRSVSARLADCQRQCGTAMPNKTLGEWADFFLELEILDPAWRQLLERLRTEYAGLDMAGFDAYMADRQTEYEQLAVYLIYRHFALWACEDYVQSPVNFACLAWQLIRALGAILWQETGEFSLCQQLELMRMFSSELEYSDQNIDIIFDELDITALAV